jgi:lactate dehydrogenase-like 2-hydroxyacid dehydrogenase
LNELLSQSDIVVVTIPFTDSSANLLHEEKINLMKNGVIIVNISSQDIINEEVLVDGLSSGKI